MSNKSNNSPKQVLSRCLHSDYFNAISDYYLRSWLPIIYIHITKCRHIKCKYYKQLMDNGDLSLSSFRFNEHYIEYITHNTPLQ